MHHNPDQCWRCGMATEKRRGWLEPYWWCPRCRGASVCACGDCEAWRLIRIATLD